MEKREPSYTAGRNVNWDSHYGQQYGSSSKNPNKELPYDPAIPLLGIYWNKTVIWKDACTRGFTAALFTKGKRNNLNVHHRWMDKEDVACTYIDIHVSIYIHMQWNTTQPFKRIMIFAAIWTDLETITGSQIKKDKYHMISLICGI